MLAVHLRSDCVDAPRMGLGGAKRLGPTLKLNYCSPIQYLEDWTSEQNQQARRQKQQPANASSRHTRFDMPGTKPIRASTAAVIISTRGWPNTCCDMSCGFDSSDGT